jgi:hypothetical protein
LFQESPMVPARIRGLDIMMPEAINLKFIAAR